MTLFGKINQLGAISLVKDDFPLRYYLKNLTSLKSINSPALLTIIRYLDVNQQDGAIVAFKKGTEFKLTSRRIVHFTKSLLLLFLKQSET